LCPAVIQAIQSDMSLREFALERYFARWEFTAPHLLSASDCEALTVRELLGIAGLGTSVLEDLQLSYIESQGTAALRDRIAAHYSGLSSEDVVVTSAPEEAIYLAMTTLLEPGDRVVVQVPCYQSLAELATHRGCEVVRWPMVETDTGWRIDLDHLADLLKSPTRLVVINAPHNPTGHLPSHDEHAALIGLTEARGCWLFSDEMYHGLERVAASRLSPAVPGSGSAGSRCGTAGCATRSSPTRTTRRSAAAQSASSSRRSRSTTATPSWPAAAR